MNITGLHLLLTYQCTFECDHCFVWGSPWQSGTMSLEDIRQIFRQAKGLGTVTTIYFEGGEPFLYYPVLSQAVREAAGLGFMVGIVTNAYWANSPEDAREALKPLAGFLNNLSISSDLYHYEKMISQQATNAAQAARELGIATGLMSIAQPEREDAARVTGQLPAGESGVMFRGRAVEKLVGRYLPQPWESFTECPHENLRDPGRVHVDAFGNLHLCQGLVMGNLFQKPLVEIVGEYDPDAHPVMGPLIEGGPVELARRYGLACEGRYVDACHLCYDVRRVLRSRFPEALTPDAMYGIY